MYNLSRLNVGYLPSYDDVFSFILRVGCWAQSNPSAQPMTLRGAAEGGRELLLSNRTNSVLRDGNAEGLPFSFFIILLA